MVAMVDVKVRCHDEVAYMGVLRWRRDIVARGGVMWRYIVEARVERKIAKVIRKQTIDKGEKDVKYIHFRCPKSWGRGKVRGSQFVAVVSYTYWKPSMALLAEESRACFLVCQDVSTLDCLFLLVLRCI